MVVFWFIDAPTIITISKGLDNDIYDRDERMKLRLPPDPKIMGYGDLGLSIWVSSCL